MSPTAHWFSLDWFLPDTFAGFHWENPIWLYALYTLLPLVFIARWWLSYRFNQKLSVAIVGKKIPNTWTSLLRFAPELALFCAMALLIISLARPQHASEQVEQWSEGIDIVLALDISQSMQIEDFKPNRLQAAREVAYDFIKNRPNDRIGLVIFSGEAFSLAPLTTDHDLLFQYLKELSFDMIESNGTAIGSALAIVTNRMRESKSASKVCILISDGDNTAGNIDPITAAELAASYNIKIYTILVGKEGLVPMGKDFFGQPNMVENTVDETAMRKLASIGSGEFFRVTDNNALKSVFAKIDKYEREEIKETRFKDVSDFYFVYLHWSIIFLLIWLGLKSTFMANVLRD